MEIEARELSVRDINRAIKAAIAQGEVEIIVREPAARHNLGVALIEPVHVRFEGSVGYYCGGLLDRARITIRGSAGWGVGESKLGGDILICGGAGNGAGAAMRGGTLSIKGSASARAGVSMKGGTLLIGGDCGYMTGFMAQKGTIIVCGDGGEALADSMYETEIFVGGEVRDLGTDAMICEPSESDLKMLSSTCGAHELEPRGEWKKVVSARELWNFKKDSLAWREAL